MLRSGASATPPTPAPTASANRIRILLLCSSKLGASCSHKSRNDRLLYAHHTRDAESRTVAPGQPPSGHARSHLVGSASSSGLDAKLVASWHENTACRAPRSSTTSYLIQRDLSTSSAMSPGGPTYPSRSKWKCADTATQVPSRRAQLSV